MVNLLTISSILSLITVIVLKIASLKSGRNDSNNCLKKTFNDLFRDHYIFFFILFNIIYTLCILSITTFILSLILFLVLMIVSILRKEKFKSLFYVFTVMTSFLCAFIPYNSFIVDYDLESYSYQELEVSSYNNNDIKYENIHNDIKDVYYYVSKEKQGWISIPDEDFDAFKVKWMQILASYKYKTNILLDYKKEFKYGYTINNEGLYVLPYRIMSENKTGYIITNGDEFYVEDIFPSFIKISPSKRELINLLKEKDSVIYDENDISVVLTKQNNVSLALMYKDYKGNNTLLVLHNNSYVSEVDLGKNIEGKYYSVYSKNNKNFLITKDSDVYYMYDMQTKELLSKGTLNNLLLNVL